MIRIRNLKLHIGHTEDDLRKKLCHMLGIRKEELLSYAVRKQSLDARKKPALFWVYTVDAEVKREKAVLRSHPDPCITRSDWAPYQYPEHGMKHMLRRPVVVGSGPAGMFCAYILAELGYRPVLLERGAPVEERRKDVDRFWETGILDPDSNVQFGEGGAGTFSDGKLNTLVKDPAGRNQKVLEIFVRHGAPENILYVNKPHIGTDILMDVVKNMRGQIIANGGEVFFRSQVVDLLLSGGKAEGVTVRNMLTGDETRLLADTVVLATGHSARDTAAMLHRRGMDMEAKAFAVGVRIEHPQEMIDQAQYGRSRGALLPAASYKLTAKLKGGRSAYTFCMCPGGYVVNASSEEGHLAVNGMSYSSRAGRNANSAVIVTVKPEDYPGVGPLAGIAFQRELEKRAFEEGEGRIPVQRFGDFCENKRTLEPGRIKPCLKGRYTCANVRSIFPPELAKGIEEGIRDFDRKIPGFAGQDAMLSGVESRTSSPVRIVRDGCLQSNLQGVYPCGEGAGYAGGITSAAMDGIKIAEEIVKKYHPFDKNAND